jgi:cytosine/adenosine deaminase-related metal-dependent hydrolase
MFEESRAAYLRRREDDVFADASFTLERMAEGARFAGRAFAEPSLGRIEPGAPADVVVLDGVRPAPLSSTNLAGHWIFGLSAGRVRDVIVAGEPMLLDRRPTRVDLQRVLADAAEAAARLWARLERTPAHPFEPEGADAG